MNATIATAVETGSHIPGIVTAGTKPSKTVGATTRAKRSTATRRVRASAKPLMLTIAVAAAALKMVLKRRSRGVTRRTLSRKNSAVLSSVTCHRKRATDAAQRARIVVDRSPALKVRGC